MFLVNYTAVLAATVASFVAGFIFYHPKVMGDKWMKLANVKMKDDGKMWQSMLIGFVGTFVTAYVLSGLLNLTNSGTMGAAMTMAFWLWLGFVGTTTLGSVAWERKPWALWVLNNCWNLLSLLIMTYVLLSM